MPGILIVEDEVLVAMQIEGNLQRQGYLVCGRVTTAERALDAARHNAPDLILLDIGLPGRMNGFDVARIFRTFSQAPIIFITGYSEDAVQSQVQAFAPARYLLKPVRVQQIKGMIDEMLE